MKESIGKRKSVLVEAEELINGDRRKDYGDAKSSFVAIANVWSVVLRKKLMAPIHPREAALMMAGFKLAREANNPKRDNRVDGAAYFELADQVSGIDTQGHPL